MPELYDEATEVTARHGEVILDGPDGVDLKLTPDAALATSDRLLAGAMTARGQQLSEDLLKRQRDEWRATLLASQTPADDSAGDDDQPR